LEYTADKNGKNIFESTNTNPEGVILIFLVEKGWNLLKNNLYIEYTADPETPVTHIVSWRMQSVKLNDECPF
jgi:hypothetical protein